MRKIMVTVMAAAVLSIGGIAWAAGPPYTVSVGGSSAAGTHPISAASTGTVKVNFKNNSGTIVNFNCTAMSWSGSVTSGVSINPLWTITSSTWSGCTIPGGALTVTQSGTWNYAGTGSNATSANETVSGRLGNMSMKWATTANPSVCSFIITGSADGSLNESTQQLVISETGYTGNLVLSSVSGCLGQIQNGNPTNFEATFSLTSPDGAINLS